MIRPVGTCQAGIAILLLLAVGAAPARAADWPRFRGANGSGLTNDKNIPAKWTATKNVKWKLKMPGKGFASPIAVGDKIFVTCFTGSVGDNLKRYLLCIDRKTGKEKWKKTVPAVLPEFRSRGRFGYHGYASSTPVSDGKIVSVLFGTTGVLTYDMDGKKLWQKSVGKQSNTMFGSATSPIVWQDLVIVAACNESATFYAFDKKTGKQVWKNAAPSLSSSYGTPIIGKNKKGEDELLMMVPEEVWSMNPRTGKLKWYATIPSRGSICTSLVSDGNIAYCVGGGGGGGRSAMAALRIGGKGDVTKSNRLWAEYSGAYVPSPVLYKGHLYWVNDNGMLYCVNAKTGKEANSKRLGSRFYASIVIAGGKIIAVSRFDGTYVLEATPKLTPISHNELGDESDFSGSPAISNGQIFLRSDTYLYCLAKE